MSDKPREKLNSIDRDLRMAVPVVGFAPDHTQLVIEKICGFELFNTRRYHNYETWSDGWRVTRGSLTVKAEDLDDAVRLFVEALAEADNEALTDEIISAANPATEKGDTP